VALTAGLEYVNKIFVNLQTPIPLSVRCLDHFYNSYFFPTVLTEHIKYNLSTFCFTNCVYMYYPYVMWEHYWQIPISIPFLEKSKGVKLVSKDKYTVALPTD
jgi:hypothetical protein